MQTTERGSAKSRLVFHYERGIMALAGKYFHNVRVSAANEGGAVTTFLYLD